MKNSIALIGFMGTGKTAVGKVLAEKLGKQFIEIDALIEQEAGRAITEIFRRDGEIFFRAQEIEATKKIAAMQNVVIACGGGVVLNQINIDRLKIESVIVYLTATPKTIVRRTSAEPGKRPLLLTINKPSQISHLLQFRRPFYERAADITVDTSELTVAEVAGKIIAELKKREDFTIAE